MHPAAVAMVEIFALPSPLMQQVTTALQHEIGTPMSITFAYAAAYYKSSTFYVLKGSFYTDSPSARKLLEPLSIFKSLQFHSKFTNHEGKWILIDTKPFDSASFAASLFIGKKTTFREWEDDGCRKLDDFYAYYRHVSIDAKEEKTFPGYVEPQKEEPVDPFKSVQFAANTTKNPTFYITIPNQCKAAGYYDPEKGRFVVLKGSRFAKEVSETFDTSSAGESRKRFIAAACGSFSDTFYEVHTSVYCKSASAAASYLAGKLSTYTLWSNLQGRSLHAFYPAEFPLG